MEIRPAHPDEREAVTACVQDAYRKWIDVIGRIPMPMLADYGALIERGVVYVVPGETGIRGVLVIWPDDGALLIENVCVCPTYQHQGIGHALLAFAENQARAAGLPEIRLYTNSLMKANIALYETLGYAEFRREVGSNYVVVWMRKPL